MSRIITPRRIETMLWVVIIFGLAAGIGFETDWGRRLAWPVQLPDSQPAQFAKPTLAPPFNMPSADTFLEVAMRPLFIFTRRPAPPIPVETTKPSMKKDQFVLTGTTVVAEGMFAHLLEKAGNKSHVIAQGKEINGILVKEIRPDRVVLMQGEETEVIVLRTMKAPSPAAATTPAAPTGRRAASAHPPAPSTPPPPPASPPEQ